MSAEDALRVVTAVEPGGLNQNPPTLGRSVGPPLLSLIHI